MASPDFHSIWLCSSSDSLYRSFNVGVVEVTPTRSNVLPVLEAPIPLFSSNKQIPDPPLLPGKTCNRSKHPKESWNSCFVPKENRVTWDSLFNYGIGADVLVITDDMSRIPAHSSVLVAVSPVLWNLVQQSKVRNGMRHIKLPGVPYDVAYAFLRFLYSSCYDEEFLKKFVLHFLVLSHSYSVPSLKRICVHTLENGWLTKENVIDVLQLARNCDAPRLSSICVSMVIKDLKTISSTDGWRVMRSSNPSLEQELVEAAVEADTRRHEKARKMEEKKVYMQLNEAMEALIHICKDGCRTIGPHDKALKGSQDYCKFPACKGLETLVRHFSNCKIRVPGGCVHCKRMWQILELHSRMCHDLDSCKVPLCGRFKEKMQQQSKKDEVKWRMLVNKVAAAKPLKPFYSSGRSG